MSASILETLMNAEINLVNNRMSSFAVELGEQQLSNAITLLKKGYGCHELVDPLLEKYGDVEAVPQIPPSRRVRRSPSTHPTICQEVYLHPLSWRDRLKCFLGWHWRLTCMGCGEAEAPHAPHRICGWCKRSWPDAWWFQPDKEV